MTTNFADPKTWLEGDITVLAATLLGKSIANEELRKTLATIWRTEVRMLEADPASRLAMTLLRRGVLRYGKPDGLCIPEVVNGLGAIIGHYEGKLLDRPKVAAPV